MRQPITSIGNSPVESMKSSENPNMSYYPFTAVVEKDADLSSGEGVSISVDGLSGDSGNSIYLEQMFIREDGNPLLCIQERKTWKAGEAVCRGWKKYVRFH